MTPPDITQDEIARWKKDALTHPLTISFAIEARLDFPRLLAAYERVVNNEGKLLRSLSDTLTNGNAATWDEVVDAASRLTARVAEVEGKCRGLLATNQDLADVATVLEIERDEEHRRARNLMAARDEVTKERDALQAHLRDFEEDRKDTTLYRADTVDAYEGSP